MNKLFGTASVNDAQERAESINARKLTNQVTRVIRIHNRGCGRCEPQTSTTHYLEYRQRKIHLYSLMNLSTVLIRARPASVSSSLSSQLYFYLKKH